MEISTDVLYDLLSQKYVLDRFGRSIASRAVTLPVFYERNSTIERGRTYIARTQDLPNKPLEECLVICVGAKPSRTWGVWRSEIIYVANAHDDVMGVFNAVQRIIGNLYAWGQRMQELALAGTRIAEMVEVSIPVFQNRITVTDYDMNVLAHCELDESDGERLIAMNDMYKRVPIDKVPIFSKRFNHYMRNREPFFVEEQGRGDNYCVNMYLGDSYIGCCALQEDLRPLRTSDLELFQLFANYIRQALAVQSQMPNGQLVTLKTVIEQLLNYYPVSSVDMHRSLELTALNLGADDLEAYKWCCVVIKSANRGKALPEGYLCGTVEGVLPNAAAIAFDDAIVAFCLIKRDEHRLDAICDSLDAYLRDMNFRAGISRTFHDFFHARDFYRQALCALQMGTRTDPDYAWYLFGDYALDYMLLNCCGDFEPDLIMAPELARLKDLSSKGVDYIDTLKVYLDNGCNAAQTAKAMYLHRSTLVQRIDRIREVVDLDTPERRLYLHMCLNLPNIDWDSFASTNVEDFG